ncbi:hypothetical protein D3C76_01820 [compost metagenome]
MVNSDGGYDFNKAISRLGKSGYNRIFEFDQFNGNPNGISSGLASPNGPMVYFYSKEDHGYNDDTLKQPLSRFISKSEYYDMVTYCLDQGMVDEEDVDNYESATFFHAILVSQKANEINLLNGQQIKLIEFQTLK